MCGCQAKAARPTEERYVKKVATETPVLPPAGRLLAADVQHELAEMKRNGAPSFLLNAYAKANGMDSKLKDAVEAVQEREGGRNTPHPPPHVQAGEELCDCQKASLKVNFVRWVEQNPMGVAGLVLLGTAIGAVVAKAVK